MKNTILLLLIIFMAFACNTSKETAESKNENIQVKTGDTIKISGDNLEYDVIIIEPGFGSYLASTAKPEGFYTQEYLENKNIRYVQEWNRRVFTPSQFNSNLYEMEINYRQGINYGYDVNYKMYNYFIYFQNRYNQNLLGTRVPQN
jgi:23S rRNA G2445 N2-methylase RlmL